MNSTSDPAPIQAATNRLQEILQDPAQRASLLDQPRAVLAPLLGEERLAQTSDAELRALVDKLTADTPGRAEALDDEALAGVAGGSRIVHGTIFIGAFITNIFQGKGLTDAWQAAKEEREKYAVMR